MSSLLTLIIRTFVYATRYSILLEILKRLSFRCWQVKEKEKMEP